ncbi:MAG: hypothetical protein ACLTO0_03605 [Blautia caecimuris]
MLAVYLLFSVACFFTVHEHWLEEGNQVKVWGYASQYMELQEGLKIVVVQPGIIERNGELVILDQNLKTD